MKCIQWNESYNIGVKEVDNQHQKLIDIMNELCDAVDSGKEGFVIEKVLNDLKEYAVEHFDLEEKYFDQFDYEKADEHKGQHKAFCKKISDLIDLMMNEGESVSNETISFIADWFVNHTQTSDREYVELFHENGVY